MTLLLPGIIRMNETTTLPILTSLIIMSAKYDFCDIRSEIASQADFRISEKKKEKRMFSEPPANHHSDSYPLLASWIHQSFSP